MTDTPRTDCVGRITAYLTHGGLWNPELAIHEAVRQLLIDCREELAAARKDAESLKWLEDNNTLHKRVEILYVVDGYEIQLMHEDGTTELSPRFHGADLSAAIDAARGEHG